MSSKKHFNIFCLFALVLLTSCLDSEDEDYYYLSDAQVYTFKVQNDSIAPFSSADSVVFYVDQLRGIIYNRDSVRYGTQLTEKLKITYSGPAGMLNITNVEAGDSVWIASEDSLDLTKPVYVRTYGGDGTTTKTYKIELNIHQIDPDSFVYTKIASDIANLAYDKTYTIFSKDSMFYNYSASESGIELYSSEDAVNWNKETLTGLPDNTNVNSIRMFNAGYFTYYANTPEGRWWGSFDGKNWDEGNYDYPIISILGTINTGVIQRETFCCVIKKDDKLIFATTSDLKHWNYGKEIPEDFPVSEFSFITYENMLVERLVLVGGYTSSGKFLNTTWATTDGMAWGKLSGGETSGSYPLIKDSNAFLYEDRFYLLNGQYENGDFNKEVYYSIDGGVTWNLSATKHFLPEKEYTFRTKASVLIGKNNFIYILGGKNNNLVLNDIWKGRVNRLISE